MWVVSLKKAVRVFLSNDPSLQPPLTTQKSGSDQERNYIPDLLQEFEKRATAAFFYEQGTEWTLLLGGMSSFGYDVGFATSVFYAAIADQFVYLPSADNWRGRVVLPVLKDSQLTIIERDVATGWIIGQSEFETVIFNDDLTEVDFPEGPIRPPMLIGASPFEIIRFSPPGVGGKDRLTIGLEVAYRQRQ